MKPNPEFDPDLVVPSPGRPRARTCGLLLLLAVVSVLALRSLRPAPARQTFAPGRAPLLAANGLLIQQPAPGAPIQLFEAPPRDRFVVMASPAIDPNMVHPAPEGIDEAMVIAPGERQSEPPAGVVPGGTVPGIPGYLPVPPNGTVPDARIAPRAPAPTKTP